MHPALTHVLKAVLVALVGAVANVIVSSFDQYSNKESDHEHYPDWED